MDQLTATIRRRYNRTAKFYDLMDFMFGPDLRRQALNLARGKVLEVGVGTGQNLPLYPLGCEVTGIDFSPEMLKRARLRAQTAKIPVDLIEMDAQQMNFPAASFDTVVATCVFCSVPDPIRGLQEIRRVCKPDGQVILLEHVRSENPFLGMIMDFLNPLTLRIVGSNINRRTVENVCRAGLQLNEVKDIKGPLVKLITAKP